MVHALMAKLGVEDVSKVAKAGDTERDIGEALNAGCRQAIGVLSGADSEAALRASGATVIVQNITKLKMAS
jgi:phosphoglycolate phosphatase